MNDEKQLARHIATMLRQMTGRDYRIAWDKLDLASLRELARALRDLDYEKLSAVNKARREPWRR